MTSIFISYSRRDRDAADFLAGELRKRGGEVFVDYQKLTAGENFIGRIGQEIERHDFFILLISPNSVASKWVQRETSWALHLNKTIIPVLLEPAKMTYFFFLIGIEHVDFRNWRIDSGEGVRKLSKCTGLPEVAVETAREEIKMEPPVKEAGRSAAGDEAEEPLVPALDREELNTILLSAAESAGQDPEKAYFLYQRALESAPRNFDEQAREFIRKEAARLKPQRIRRLKEKAEEALNKGDLAVAKQFAYDILELDRKSKDLLLNILFSQASGQRLAGNWVGGEQTAEEILRLNPNNEQGSQLFELCRRNRQFDPFYEQAVTAIQMNRRAAAMSLISHLRKKCPGYGDPRGAFSDLPICPEYARSLKNILVLSGHRNFIVSMAFVNHDQYLVTSDLNASKDRDVGEGLKDKQESDDGEDREAKRTRDKDGGEIYYWDMTALKNLYAQARLNSKRTPIRILNEYNQFPEGQSFYSDEMFPSCYYHGIPPSSSDWDQMILSTGNRYYAQIMASPNYPLIIKREGEWISGIPIGHDKRIEAGAFSPDANTFATGSADKTVKLWDCASKEVKVSAGSKNGGIFALAYSNDGKLLACGEERGTITLRDPSTGEVINTMKGHEGVVRALLFLQSDRVLVSVSQDNTIRLWDLGGHKELISLPTRNATVYMLAATADERLLASASIDRKIWLWGIQV